MEFLLIIIIILLLLYIAKGYFKSHSEFKQPQKYPYEQKNLLSKTEYTFFRTLNDFCTHNNLLFCPKVRMEDFISVTDKENHAKFRGYIKSRHIDFIICDKSLHILCGIELDDKSHNTDRAKKTDDFKNKVFEQIKLPLFRIKTSDNYNDELNKIYNILYPAPQNNK